MPYILSPHIHPNLPGLWGEGSPYSRDTVYDINSNDPAQPPVNYQSHLLKPHSIPHIDAEGHITRGGKTVDAYYEQSACSCFYGKTVVVKLRDAAWEQTDLGGATHTWCVSASQLQAALTRVLGHSEMPDKLFISAEDAPYNSDGFHDPAHVLVLNEDAAKWLVSNPNFNAFGTSWKSSDFMPNSHERPIHKTLLPQAVLFECLKLDHVPEGIYWLTGFPLLLQGASESPLTPVLFEMEELVGVTK